jgi:hypothetical protein
MRHVTSTKRERDLERERKDGKSWWTVFVRFHEFHFPTTGECFLENKMISTAKSS